MQNSECWYIVNDGLEFVNKFTYLRILFNFNKKAKAEKQVIRKALFEHKNLYGECHLMILLSLFGCFIDEIVNYFSDIWGKIHVAITRNLIQTFVNKFSELRKVQILLIYMLNWAMCLLYIIECLITLNNIIKYWKNVLNGDNFIITLLLRSYVYINFEVHGCKI